MYVKKEDFSYFENLCKDLEEAKKKKFMELIRKEAGKRTGDIGKIRIVGDDIFDSRGIEPGEFIRRTMIKKACKDAKEG